MNALRRKLLEVIHRRSGEHKESAEERVHERGSGRKDLAGTKRANKRWQMPG